jgi:hypothetical protein
VRTCLLARHNKPALAGDVGHRWLNAAKKKTQFSLQHLRGAPARLECLVRSTRQHALYPWLQLAMRPLGVGPVVAKRAASKTSWEH